MSGLDVIDLLVPAFAQTLDDAVVATPFLWTTTQSRFLLLSSSIREWCEGPASVSPNTWRGVGKTIATLPDRGFGTGHSAAQGRARRVSSVCVCDGTKMEGGRIKRYHFGVHALCGGL